MSLLIYAAAFGLLWLALDLQTKADGHADALAALEAGVRTPAELLALFKERTDGYSRGVQQACAEFKK